MVNLTTSQILLSAYHNPAHQPDQFFIDPAHLAHPRWRGTSSYRKWKELVIERDGRCVCCGSLDSLHAHHIKHATYWPQLKFTITNGITLCSTCHYLFHNDVIGNTRKKCDEVQLADFFKVKSHFANLTLDYKLRDLKLPIEATT